VDVDRDDLLVIGCPACEHAASLSEPLQWVHQQQHGAVRASQHDAYCRESFGCWFFQIRLSCIHSTVSNYRSSPGMSSWKSPIRCEWTLKVCSDRTWHGVMWHWAKNNSKFLSSTQLRVAPCAVWTTLIELAVLSFGGAAWSASRRTLSECTLTVGQVSGWEGGNPSSVLPDCLHGLLLAPFLLSYSVFDFILFFLIFRFWAVR